MGPILWIAALEDLWICFFYFYRHFDHFRESWVVSKEMFIKYKNLTAKFFLPFLCLKYCTIIKYCECYISHCQKNAKMRTIYREVSHGMKQQCPRCNQQSPEAKDKKSGKAKIYVLPELCNRYFFESPISVIPIDFQIGILQNRQQLILAVHFFFSLSLKVPKCENFHRTDFFYFYTIKPL